MSADGAHDVHDGQLRGVVVDFQLALVGGGFHDAGHGAQGLGDGGSGVAAHAAHAQQHAGGSVGHACHYAPRAVGVPCHRVSAATGSVPSPGQRRVWVSPFRPVGSGRPVVRRARSARGCPGA
nr:MGMT family protein [Deinococcus sp. RM]